jgi:hypothetical protein
MPMFNPAFALDPEEMLRRLQRTGGDPPLQLLNGEDVFRATQPQAAGSSDGLLSGLDFGKMLAGAKPPQPITAPPGLFPVRGASDEPDRPPVGSGNPFVMSPQLPPPQTGPGAFGSMLDNADAFLRATGGSRPSFAAPPSQTQVSPFTPATAPQMPAFTPAQLPEKTPFAPVQVDGAIRTGMFNPAGNSPWDRSMTANSAEEELRLRQDAKYNQVLDMIRPGGIGMPGTTGPIVGLQPHEVAALNSLGGRMANDATQGRQIASTEATATRGQDADILRGNQTAQTARDTALLNAQTLTNNANLEALTKRDVANIEAGSRNNPEVLKQQAVAQMAAAAIAGGADQETVAAHIASFRKALADSGAVRTPGAIPGVVPGQTATQVEANDDEVNATRFLNQVGGIIGQGKVGPEFKYKEGFGVQDADKVLDFLASQRAAGKLSPGVEAGFWRQAQRLPNFNQFRDNLVRSGAGANYQVQPPMDPNTKKPVDLKSLGTDYRATIPPYVVSDDGNNELYRYQQNPDTTVIRSAAGKVYGQIPYGQVVLPNGAGVIDMPDSVMNPAGWSKKVPPEVLNARKAELDAMIRRLYPATKK